MNEVTELENLVSELRKTLASTLRQNALLVKQVEAMKRISNRQLQEALKFPREGGPQCRPLR